MTNINTGSAIKGRTNEAGNYQVPFLLPGTYKVSVESSGFKKIERSDIRVTITGLVTVDFTLEVGSTTESVTVTAAPPLLEVASGDLAQVVTREFVETIEFSTDRNVASLAVLSPGVNGNAGGTYTAATHANISINGGGGSQGSNEYLIDGIPNTAAGGAPVFIPAIDSVDEFKVHTTMFDAALGHTNGGVISMTTKGGTNELHGTGYWYNRGTSLQANSWINNRNGSPRPPVKYNQFGYAVNGPVYLPKLFDGRNRTFFSTTLERDNDNRSLTPNYRVPTALEKQGDFSQTRNRLGGAFAIYDPEHDRRHRQHGDADAVSERAHSGVADRSDRPGDDEDLPRPDTAGDPADRGAELVAGGLLQREAAQLHGAHRPRHLRPPAPVRPLRDGAAARRSRPAFLPRVHRRQRRVQYDRFHQHRDRRHDYFVPDAGGHHPPGPGAALRRKLPGRGRLRPERAEASGRYRAQPVLPGLAYDRARRKLSAHGQPPYAGRQRHVLPGEHLYEADAGRYR